MNFKKIISVTSAFTVAIAALSGCGAKNNGAKIDIDSSKMDEKLEIKWMGLPYNPSAQEGVYPETVLEEKFNIDIKPMFLDNTKYNDKKTMLLAGGEQVDLIYELDPANVKQDADQGLIMEVPYDIIKKYAPTVYNIICEQAPEAWLYSRVEDKNYGIPNLNYNNARARSGVWRTDWLKNVGIDKIPETIVEMHDALYKFANNDPDGNGKKDTYGMSSDITNWHTMFTDIFGAYGVLPFDWMKSNGEVVYGGFEDGTTEALKTLQQWYSEGIIDPDFITDNIFSTGKDKFKNGKVGFMNQNGGYWDPNDTSSLPNQMKQINPSATIENSLPVTGPDGKSGTFCWGAPSHVVAFGAQLEQQPEKLVRLLTIFESLVTDEDLLSSVKLGQEGKHWEFRDQQAKFEKGIKFLPPYDDSSQQKNECLTSEFGSASFFAPVSASYETAMKFTEKKKQEVNDKYCPIELGMSDLFMKPDTLPSAADYFADLRTKQINLMVEVIKGEKSTDDYKKEFKEIWSNGGGDTLLEEAKEMGSTIEKMYNEVGVDKK
ncbi:MAG: hypothetical protein SOS24_09695 [Clostridia bacterium]|nr:hypothetical protein [Clostridia bacterium]